MFLSPRGDQERPKIAPRPPQDHPKTAQERPKTAQERLKTAQDDPRATQDEARPPQERPRSILPYFLERKRLQEAFRRNLPQQEREARYILGPFSDTLGARGCPFYEIMIRQHEKIIRCQDKMMIR